MEIAIAIIGLISAFLPTILRAVGLYFDKKAGDSKASQLFWDWYTYMNTNDLWAGPAKEKESIDQQNADLDEMERKDHEEKKT